MIGLVRRADVSDAAALAMVHVESWKTTYRGLMPDDFLDSLDRGRYAERWQRSLRDDTTRVYVAEDHQEVVAYASCGPERAGENGFEGELYAISFDGRIYDFVESPLPSKSKLQANPYPPDLGKRKKIASLILE